MCCVGVLCVMCGMYEGEVCGVRECGVFLGVVVYHMQCLYIAYILKGMFHLFPVSSTPFQACRCACHCCAISLCCFSLKVSV